MVFGLITFLTAITISGVAIYYSVAGLAAIFAAAVIPIIVMGVSLEIGKLVTAVWLHRNWKKAVWWMRTYLSVAVIVLMFITSMGIFGFLSKAHIEQTSMSQEQVALIDTLNDKETRSQAKIERWRGELDRLMKGENVRVDSLIEKEQEGLDKIYARIKQEKDGFRADANAKIEQQQLRITQAQERRDAEIKAAEKKFEGSLGGTKAYEDAVKKAKDNELSVASRAQAEILKINEQLDKDLKTVDSKYAKDIADINTRIQDLRNQANNKTVDIEGKIKELEGFIETEQKVVDEIREEKFGYEKEYRKLEAEVGPIKYIAEFIYGEQADQNLLEAAVKWVIIIIIFVFDPLAVLLLIASQYTFHWYREEKGLIGPGGDTTPPKSDPDPEPSSDPDPEPEVETEEPIEEPVHEPIEETPVEEPQKKMTDKRKDDTELEEVINEVDEIDQVDDLEKWNEWVDAANRAVEEEIQKEEVVKIVEPKAEAKKDNNDDDIPDTRNRIFYDVELTPEFQKKRQNATSYITKVQNKQIRLKTDPPEELDQTSQK